MYKNYIFDLYGTLVDINTNEENKLVWDKISLFYCYNNAFYTSDEIKSKYKSIVINNLNSHDDLDYPDFPIENVFKELYLSKNVKPSEELINATAQFFRVLSINKLNLYEGVIDLLRSLKQRNKKIYLLTNAQKIFTSYEINLLNISHYFDGILYSSESKICKPNLMFFKELINKYNINSNETIMIGNDYFCDIKPAIELNIDTLYIHSNISPDITITSNATYNILDGNFLKVKPLILK
ncbi:MAG: HAD family hydrolase [Clostridium sartagoforme]|nr:HAD family hydrolase [Clostridium sartagoforme]